MADGQDQPAARTRADKERSRQQSRQVSGKEAARGVSGQPGRGQKSSPGGPSQKGGAGAPRSGPSRGGPAKVPAKQGDGRGRRSPRPRGSSPSSSPRRSPTALMTWGLVALVLIIVVVLVIVKITGSSPSTSSAPLPTPVPATIAHQVTGIPATVYDKVGITSSTDPVSAPSVVSGQPPLKFDGKPGVFYMGGEFCPYCAAERWAIIAALSRFGTFSGLETMQSSSTDVYPSTQTFTFANATYTSPYLVFQTREFYSNQPNSAGTGYTILQPLDKVQNALVTKYDTAKYTGGSPTSSGSIPFIDFGNKALVSGSSYSPSILQGLTRSDIAGGLTDPSDPVTQAIVASSNYLSASACATDGEQPHSVCASKGVTEAAKAMKLRS